MPNALTLDDMSPRLRKVVGRASRRVTSAEEPDGGNLLVRIWRGVGLGDLPAYSTKAFCAAVSGACTLEPTSATRRQTRLASGVLARLARAARTLRSTPEQGRGRCSTPTAGLDTRRRTGYGRPTRASGSGQAGRGAGNSRGSERWPHAWESQELARFGQGRDAARACWINTATAATNARASTYQTRTSWTPKWTKST